MVSAFNREVETEKEYNGRQLLELLQNADDEKSEEVRIDLDTSNNVLTISNRGDNCTTFSDKGIRSLMISNLSTKTSKKFIGNKGLGFRSIINWSESIIINSNNLDIEFSNEIVNEVFDELFSLEDRKSIRKEQNLPESIYPIPFLSIPKVSDKVSEGWKTSIKINYKPKFEDDIKKQIDDLKNEILLFLNHIERLDIVIDGNAIQTINKSELSERWTVYERTNELPKEYWDKENEKESYDLKVALQDDLSCDIKELFAYFPTKLLVDFPFIIHGTFELNSSRNEINDSLKNRYILSELVKLIVSTAKDLAEENVSFKALEMLSYSNKNNILADLKFYDAIDEAIETLDIFPCLDGKYRSKSEILFSDSLSMFVQNVEKEHLFKNVVIPMDGAVELSKLDINESIDDKSLIELSRSIDSFEDRASMIYMFFHNLKHQNKLEFLVDSEGDVISLDDDVYTPSSMEFSIPDYVNIKFIHKDLYTQLIAKFGIESNEKARELQRILKEITNIQQYQPVPVLQKIISGANKLIKESNVDKIEIIKKMVLALYENYKNLKGSTSLPEAKIQLLNKNEDLIDAKELYLSNYYPSGELTEFLFEGIFNDEDYLADFTLFGLQDFDKNSIEQFFLWLGVNKYTKFIDHESVISYGYESFVFEHIKKPNNYRDYSLVLTEIDKFAEIIEKLPLEKLVIWFSLDSRIFGQLDNVNNDDLFKFSVKGDYTNYYFHELRVKPSFIAYQVKSKGVFNDYFVGNDKWSPLINETEFNFEHEAFERLDLNRADIESILLKLGAVDKFEKLSIEAIKRIVDSLHLNSSEGKQTQAIYKLCIKHFERNNHPIDTSKTKLFATKDEVKRYFPASEVYYNGNIKLPKKITSSKAILNYPRRQSTTNVIDFFGINNLSSLEITIAGKNNLEHLTSEFSNFLETITPYILVYRIQDIEKDKLARTELAKLNNINIYICDHVRYTIDGESFELEDNDYIRDEKDYFIKVDKYSSLKSLRHNFEFQECFADIIGLVFDIQETKIFRDMVKEEDSYIEKTIRNDIGSDELVRTRELLGISDEYYSFWKTIYTLVDKNYEFESDDQLLDNVINDLEIESNIAGIDYPNLNSLESCTSILGLFKELGIDIVQFNKCDHSYYKIDFTNIHRFKLKQTFENNLYDFKQRLYSWCVENSEEHLFTSHIGTYEHNEEFVQLVSLEHKNILTLDYKIKVEQFINENFDFTDSESPEVDFRSIFKENKKKVEIGYIEGNIEYLSMLYFDHKIDDIKKYIDSKLALEAEEIAKSESDKDNEQPVKQIKKAKKVTLNKPKPTNGSRAKSKKPYKHSSSSDERKKEIGDNSEEDVYMYLVDVYGQSKVNWSSDDDDGSGYDIKYINDEEVTKYVEVKTFSGNKFHITKTEIEFAKNNFGQYEIFLVGEEIQILEDIDFDNKAQFLLEGQDFLVSYNIV
jgi:hypothetical protein